MGTSPKNLQHLVRRKTLFVHCKKIAFFCTNSRSRAQETAKWRWDLKSSVWGAGNIPHFSFFFPTRKVSNRQIPGSIWRFPVVSETPPELKFSKKEKKFLLKVHKTSLGEDILFCARNTNPRSHSSFSHQPLTQLLTIRIHSSQTLWYNQYNANMLQSSQGQRILAQQLFWFFWSLRNFS